MTVSVDDIADLLPLMPRARDALRQRAELPPQTDDAGNVLSKPVLHFALALEDRQPAREFLEDHGASVAVYRLDPRDEGMLMVGLANDSEAKRIAREELNRDVPEECSGNALKKFAK